MVSGKGDRETNFVPKARSISPEPVSLHCTFTELSRTKASSYVQPSTPRHRNLKSCTPAI